MPMIDVFIPRDALEPAAEQRLFEEMTDILLRAEGFDPSNEVARSVSVLYVHRPEAVYVGGSPAEEPRYRIVPTVPEGQYTQQAVQTLVEELTDAVARAEGGIFEDVSPRVWVFPTEVSDGRWGGRGTIRRLPEIQALLAGESERCVGVERLKRRRLEKASEFLGTLGEALGRSFSEPGKA